MSEEIKPSGTPEIKDYATYGLTISRDDSVIHKGSYALKSHAMETIEAILEFKLNEEEIKAIDQKYGVCGKHQSQRMGNLLVRMHEKFEKEIGDTHFHINNGGVSLAVVHNQYGIVVKVHASHFGNETNNIELNTNLESLKATAKMFADAVTYFEAQKNLSEYCCPAAIWSSIYKPIDGGLTIDSDSKESDQ